MAGSIINTFDKGLHQDSSFVLQPDGTYRNMKNGMLISHDGNHYSIELSEGNKVILDLPSRYHSNINNYTDKDVAPMPIGFISFLDKLVVFFTNKESNSGGYGEIGVISFTKIGNDFISTYTPYYHHPRLNLTKYHKIEGFAFRENDNIERVYWTDNFNEPRVFDIANPMFTTYIYSGGLVSGKQYMVLKGVLGYNGYYYGPSDDSSTAVEVAPYVNSNIFTANATATYSVVDGPVSVIEYYPIELLDWTPSRLLGNIGFVEYGTGSKYCGSSIYFYRLSSDDGFRTSWSYPSTPMHIGVNNETAYLGGDAYADFVGNGSSVALVNSNKSIKIKISGIDTNFDNIEVAVMEFNQKDDVPYSINLILKQPISSSEMTLEDLGQTNLGTVTINDLTLFPASILKVKTLSTNKNYNIIANIIEREEFDIDLSGVEITTFEHPLICHGDTASCGNGTQPGTPMPVVGDSPADTTIRPYARYLVSSADDTSNRVEYPVASGTYYYTGDVFVGVAGSTTATFTGTAKARPCATRKKYTPITSLNPLTTQRNDAIELKTAFWDYKDPTIASHNRGYWSNEKYRFGILFFDKKGNPFYVRNLMDSITGNDLIIPTISDKGGLIISDSYSGGVSYSLNPTGINISKLDIPKSVMNQISGFSIVRAERDVRIVTQGLVTRNIRDTTTIDIVYPEGNMDGLFVPAGRTLYDNVYCYISPDLNLVGFEPSHPVGNVGNKMEEAGWIEGVVFGTSIIKADGINRRTFSKMFTNVTSDASSPRKFNVGNLNGSGFKRFDEFGQETDFDGTTFDYENRSYLHPAAASSAFINMDCAIDGGTTGFNYQVNGCLKYVFKPDVAFKHYGTSNSYGDTSQIYNNKKILVNCLSDTDVSNQYGGISEASLANTLYMSTGHFQEVNATVIAETDNGGDICRFNNIQVFGGDCYTCLIDLGYSLWNVASYGAGDSLSYSIFFPMECNSNYNLRRGRKVSNSSAGPINVGEEVAADPVQLEDYSYNHGYTSEGIQVKYPSLPVNYRFTGKFEYRTRWTSPKYPGELIDSFRTFVVNDYRDLDGQRGEINNLKVRDSKLFFWQNHSVGYLPILERQLVGGSALGDATALGVGGVIDRFDDIDTYFGNQHQHGLIETEFGFIWFDMRRRALMVMTTGGGVQEISLAKGLQVFFNNEFNEGDIFLSDGIYNTNNNSIPEIPLLGYGIVGVYDPRYKMSYLTFKYSKDTLIDLESEIVTREAKDFTIGYSHVLNAIIGFYDFTPAIWHNHNDLVLSSNNSKNRVYYGSNMPETSFVVGDTVSINTNTIPNTNGEYVCIAPVTIDMYPPSVANKAPDYSGSIYFVKTNEQNEVYLQTFNTEYLKFYGQVYNHELEIIVNPKTELAITPQNIQVKGNSVNYTDVYCDTDAQSSSDLNIASTNRNYRFIDGAWFSSLPLPRNGRLTDYYTKIKYVYKGYISNPTVSKNVNKFVTWIKTFLIQKR